MPHRYSVPEPGATIPDGVGNAWEVVSYDDANQAVVLVCTQPNLDPLTGSERVLPVEKFIAQYPGAFPRSKNPADYAWPWLPRNTAARSTHVGRPDQAPNVDWDAVLADAQEGPVPLYQARGDDPRDFTMSLTSMRVRVYREARARGLSVSVAADPTENAVLVAPAKSPRRRATPEEQVQQKLRQAFPLLQPHEVTAVINWAGQLNAAHGTPEVTAGTSQSEGGTP